MRTIVMIRSNPVNPDPRIEKQANALIKHGYCVKILAWDRTEKYEPALSTIQLKNGSAEIIRIGLPGEFSGGFTKNGKSLLLFMKFIFLWLIQHKEEYEIIHACDFDTGLIAYIVARSVGKKMVYDIADYYVASHGLHGAVGKIVAKMENYVINHVDAVIICTEQRKEQIKGTKPRRLIVIHNTPDTRLLDSFNQRTNHQTDALKIAYVGVLGFDRFLDKIVDVVENRKDCEFHIGGFGNNLEPFFLEKSQRCERIRFYGKLSYDRTLELEQSCDILTAIYDPEVPNHRYAAPNKFYEALMLGKPLIMVKNTGMAQEVEENDIGCVIDYTKEDLNRAFDILISRREEWTAMGNRAYGLYEKKYAWSIMEQRLQDLYDEL